MKTEKMSFKNVKDILSRDEMKKIMAGSGDLTCTSGPIYNSGGAICKNYTCIGDSSYSVLWWFTCYGSTCYSTSTTCA